MKVQRLGSCENFVGKSEELVFDAFSDPEPVKRAWYGSDIAVDFFLSQCLVCIAFLSCLYSAVIVADLLLDSCSCKGDVVCLTAIFHLTLFLYLITV